MSSPRDISLTEKMGGAWFIFFGVVFGHALGWLPFWVLVAAGVAWLLMATWAYLWVFDNE